MTGKTRGFGFVVFSNMESYQKALQVPVHTIKGEQIHIRQTHTRKEMKDRRVNNNESFASDFNMPEPFYLDQTQFDNGNLFSNTNMMLNMQPLIQMAVLNNQHNKEDKKKLNINQNN